MIFCLFFILFSRPLLQIVCNNLVVVAKGLISVACYGAIVSVYCTVLTNSNKVKLKSECWN